MKRIVLICAAGILAAGGVGATSPLRTVDIEGPAGKAILGIQGGLILSWKAASGAELLFMPRQPESSGGDWSHGGISICWPWFGKKGPAASSIHGFARNRRFTVLRRAPSAVTLGLSLAAGEVADFPYAAGLELTVRMADRLEMTLRTTNCGDKPFTLTEGIQPYFVVGRYADVTLRGVKQEIFAVEDGMDAAFPRLGDDFGLADRGTGRELRMRAGGNTGVVVWSPGKVEPHNRNLEAGDTERFIGLGPSSRAKEGAISLAPGASHELTFSVEVVPAPAVKRRPLLIGVTEQWKGGEQGREKTPIAGVQENYTEAIRRGGNIPVVICRTAETGHLAQAVAPLDILILSGGADVEPARYGAKPSPKLGLVQLDRDAFDFAVLEAALARNLPVLGICRGAQLINVYLGGTLWQDLPSEFPVKGIRHRKSACGERRHLITIEPDSRLAAVLGTTAIGVNSQHHQAVKDLAPGLRIVARAPDGVVEAFEHTTLPVAGVQFHPEGLVRCADDMFFSRLFRNLPAFIGFEPSAE